MNRKAEKLQVTLDEEVNDHFSFTGSGLFDSIDFMDLIVEFEEEFGIEADFNNFEPEVFTKLEGFVDCVMHQNSIK